MSLLDNVIITEIEKPFIYFSEKGHVNRMENRPSYCLAFCQSGQITYTQNGTDYVLTPRRAILLPQGSSYTGRGDKRSVVHAVNFCGEGIACDTITLFELKDPSKHLANSKRLSELFALPDKRLTIFSTFYDILQCVHADEVSAQNPLRPLLDYIERHIGDPELNNTVLAQKISVSEVYLRRLFAAHCGVTPKQYILNLRVEKAKQMLADNLYTVTAIAEKCGFSGVYHFCRVFKQRTNTTPSEYADRHIVYKI